MSAPHDPSNGETLVTMAHTICHHDDVDVLADGIMHLEQQRATLAEAAAKLLETLMDPNKHPVGEYDRVAELFYQETGMMSPGKSEPMEMSSRFSLEERQLAWRAWFKARRDRVAELVGVVR
jgi:hypothetical protein